MNRHPSRPALRVVVTGSFAVVALALTGCGPDITAGDASASDRLQAPTAEQPAGEITIWDRSGDLYEVFDAVIDDFEAKYPEITVNHEAVDINAKLQNTLITGTDVPDGVFLDDALVGGYAEHLWDVTDVLEPYVDDIAPQKIDATTVADGIYGVPFDLNPGLLYYNAAALEAVGIDATTI